MSVIRALKYLKETQKPAGNFISYSSPTKRPFQEETLYETTFVTSLILDCLSSVPHSETIRTPLAAWLLAQKNDNWSFNYWSTMATERTTMPYPDDLDDTCCALAALYRHNPKLIDGHALGKIVRLLLVTEEHVGGPYRTWITDTHTATIWKDVDLAVNSNIAYFLRLCAHPLPNLTEYIEQAVLKKKINSPYYPSVYPILYYMARGYSGKHKKQIAQEIYKRRRNGNWGTPLQTALAISTLCFLGETNDISKAVVYLITSQQADGSWPAEPFCIDPAQGGKPYYNGCASLTTAIVLEALCFGSKENTTLPAERTHIHRTDEATTLFEAVIDTAKQECAPLDKTLRLQLLTTVERMAKGNHNREIVLLPYFFATALPNSTVTKRVLIQLGLANLYGWAAYDIYDDFLDGSGDVRLLSAANVALRRSLAHFNRAVPHPTAYTSLVTDIFDTIDGANAWEVMHCRFAIHGQQVVIGTIPTYETRRRLAERSLGHALPPLGVLASNGYALDTTAVRSLLITLRHYLIARQLHDDLLDWEADVRAGQCSYVVARLLADLHITPGTYAIDTLLADMRAAYLDHCFQEIGATMLQEIRSARRALAKSKLLTPKNSVTQLLDDLASSITHELYDHKNTQAFLDSYTA